MTRRSALTAFLAAPVLLATLLLPAGAQVPGQVRAQGQLLPTGDEVPSPAAPPSAFLDYREEMRRFIQAISAYARSQRRDFIVIVQNGLALLTKTESGDETRVAPARTFMRTIDGVLQEAVFFGSPELDRPTPPERRETLLAEADLARRQGLKLMVVDYARTPETVDEAYRLSAARGFVPLVAVAPEPEDPSAAWLAQPPFAAHGNSVLSLDGVRNFLLLRGAAGFGRQDEFALALHRTNHDMLVVDVLLRAGEPLAKRTVDTLKYKNLGARRLVLAFMNIGAAETHRHYWRPEWREGSPVWISAPYPGNPDKYFVEFWRPEWQAIIAGDVRSYTYGIIDQGFDGVVLEGIESYRFFESGLEAFEPRR